MSVFINRRLYQEMMVNKIRSIVARVWSNSHVECYGSYATHLCIPSSDLDLVVLLSPSSTLLCSDKSVETNAYVGTLLPPNLAKRTRAHLCTCSARAQAIICCDEIGHTCKYWSRSCVNTIGSIPYSSSIQPRYLLARFTTTIICSCDQ